MEAVSINMHKKERDEIVKRILCYGDSNTWGYQAVTGSRYPEEVRWPCILQKLLGDAYHVYENGLNGRTTVFEDDYDPYRSGVKEIIPAIMVTEPLDLIVLMLGTNDTKNYFGKSGHAIAKGMELLIRTTQDYFLCEGEPVPQILVLGPIDIAEDIEQKENCCDFDCESVQKMKDLKKKYPEIAQSCGCLYLDAAASAAPSEEDGIHMTPEGHRALAEAVADFIRSCLP